MGGETDGHDGGRAVLWCRHCGQPVKRARGAPGKPGKAVHSGNGSEKCADGEHTAVPVDVDPGLRHIAARAREKYPEYDIGVVYGYLLRAAWRVAVGTPIPVEATTEEELLAGIARQVRMRELDEQRAERIRAEAARYGSTTL
jgi:hypothetical protein